jgi:chromosome segregation ATPase
LVGVAQRKKEKMSEIKALPGSELARASERVTEAQAKLDEWKAAMRPRWDELEAARQLIANVTAYTEPADLADAMAKVPALRAITLKMQEAARPLEDALARAKDVLENVNREIHQIDHALAHDPDLTEKRKGELLKRYVVFVGTAHD